MPAEPWPVGTALNADIEDRRGVAEGYRARVRWNDPFTGRRRSLSQACRTVAEAESRIAELRDLAAAGVDPQTVTMTLAAYGESVMTLALRGLEAKTLDPYLAGWRKRVVPSLGHLPVRMITQGAVDRAVHAWIADEASRSTVKNSLAILVRVLEQAVRDGIVEHNRARVTGWQREYQQVRTSSTTPARSRCQTGTRSSSSAPHWSRAHTVAMPDGPTLWSSPRAPRPASARPRACGAPTSTAGPWTWNVRRQTTPAPAGVVDKSTKGKRARVVPIIPEIRPLVDRRLNEVSDDPMACLLTGPRGGRVTTAVLRDATHWDGVVTALGYDYLRRHDLRHTGPGWPTLASPSTSCGRSRATAR